MKIIKQTALLLTMTLVSCLVAPRPIYIIEPAEESGVWIMGKQYFHQQSDHIEIVIAFDKMDYDEYQFHVEITNLGKDAILVAPENFYLVTHNYIQHLVVSDTIDAYDPEQEIYQARINRSQEYAAYQSVTATQTLFSFVDLIVDIAEIDEPKSEAEIFEEENEDLQSEIDALETELEHERAVKSINNQFTKWESKALRKTTLPKDYLLRGKIFFPLIEKADALEIHITLEDIDIDFKYNQFVEKVR